MYVSHSHVVRTSDLALVWDTRTDRCFLFAVENVVNFRVMAATVGKHRLTKLYGVPDGRQSRRVRFWEIDKLCVILHNTKGSTKISDLPYLINHNIS